AHILNAEGEKIQAIVAMEGASAEELLAFNSAAVRVINSIARLESVLQAKLETFSGECAP
ncbi:MAG: hypothetical protein FWE86_05265, partial [Oscillospiraceae bacterium]|nr:hypothetical protein [Oscillospiraceae bacterium]